MNVAPPALRSRPTAHLVPPPVEDVLVKAKWHIKMTAFVRLRARDPARARALLAKPPKGLKEKDRRNLIQFLREGLSDDDRDLLEREKSRLLVRLPGSSLWNELAALADNLLTVTGGKLRITPPDRFTELFERLGFQKDALDSSWADYTAQEFWCYQFLSEVPLGPGAQVAPRPQGDRRPVPRRAEEQEEVPMGAAQQPLRDAERGLESGAARASRTEGLDGDDCLSLARHLPPREREAALEPLIDNEPNYTINEFDDVLEYVWNARVHAAPARPHETPTLHAAASAVRFRPFVRRPLRTADPPRQHRRDRRSAARQQPRHASRPRRALGRLARAGRNSDLVQVETHRCEDRAAKCSATRLALFTGKIMQIEIDLQPDLAIDVQQNSAEKRKTAFLRQ
jgi:hypothetical protein